MRVVKEKAGVPQSSKAALSLLYPILKLHREALAREWICAPCDCARISYLLPIDQPDAQQDRHSSDERS